MEIQFSQHELNLSIQPPRALNRLNTTKLVQQKNRRRVRGTSELPNPQQHQHGKYRQQHRVLLRHETPI